MLSVLTTPFASSVLVWFVKHSPFQKSSRIILVLSGISSTTITVYALLLLRNHYLSSTTPVAAAGLVLVMIGTAATHARRNEYPNIAGNLVLLALAVIVVYGRFIAVPL